MDWLLAAHQVAPLQYEMGGLWTPVSVRDQMVRGQEIVRRAIAAGLIDRERPLIVVGAGAGGMAAAVTADNAQIPSLVVERGTQLFRQQSGVTSRVIHPYLYDWPHDRHTADTFGAPAVLPWKEEIADHAAREWAAALAGRRLVAFDSKVSAPPAPGGSPIQVRDDIANVHITTREGSGWFRGGMVLSCTGFGTEVTSIPAAQGSRYEGLRFWENDTMASHHLGGPVPPVVLIAGGGDGAVQDAIRALLAPQVHDFRRLLEALPRIPDRVRTAIADAEDRATRAWLWSCNAADDCSILSELDHRIQMVIDDWWRLEGWAVADTLARLWRGDVAGVHLVHGCSHFARSYPLNRFLLFILEKALEEARPEAPRFQRTSGFYLASVDGGHACGAQRPCWGPHVPSFAPRTCVPEIEITDRPPSHPFDLIILRGGVAAPPMVLARSPVANRRQYLPDRVRPGLSRAHERAAH